MKPTRRPHTTQLSAGALVTLRVDSVGSDGVGEGSIDNHVVRVAGAFPGERIKARIVNLARQRPIAHGLVHEVIDGLPARRVPPCVHHESAASGRCTGCPWMSLAPQAQGTLKRARLEALGLVVDNFVADSAHELGYRWSSKRVAVGPAGRLMLGSFVRGTHRVAEMTHCHVEHPLIRACAEQLQRLANELRIAGFDEQTRVGTLRYVWFKTNGAEVLVTLILAEAVTDPIRQLAAQLSSAAGVCASVQAAEGNVIRGGHAELLHGVSTLTMDVAGVALTVGALGFLQPNPKIAAAAYLDLTRLPDGTSLSGSLALDVYAGAGATTALLKPSFTQVLANDSDPASAEALGVVAQDALSFLAQQQQLNAKPNLVLCNPPRGGMGNEVCDALLSLAPTRIHIMSCNPESLARDLERLSPHYDLTTVRAYDTLPQTPHVETVAWLNARSSNAANAVTNPWV